jgi:hypothetical protein
MSRPEPVSAESAWELVDYDEGALIDGLEPDQLAAAAARPVPRAHLSPRVRLALWALRIFVLVVGAMVIYTFVHQTIHGP